MENKRLRAENEQLRGIFDDAVDQFNSLKKKVEKLSGELEEERKSRKELEKQNLLLKKELSSERAKANKFGDMLFGLKSEKLKLSDIKIVDDDTLAVDESVEDDRGRKDKSSENESSKKKKKKTGGQPGHEGSGRTIPAGLPIVDNVISLPAGEVIHGIPVEDWVEQKGMDEISYIIRKKTIWYVERIIRSKYAPPENSAPETPKFITAPMPGKRFCQNFSLVLTIFCT
jgi:hypothetical protein